MYVMSHCVPLSVGLDWVLIKVYYHHLCDTSIKWRNQDTRKSSSLPLKMSRIGLKNGKVQLLARMLATTVAILLLLSQEKQFVNGPQPSNQILNWQESTLEKVFIFCMPHLFWQKERTKNLKWKWMKLVITTALGIPKNQSVFAIFS